MPEPRELRVDQILTNFSILYRNEMYLWRNVLPMVKVMKLSDKYPIYTKADSFRVRDDRIGPNALPNEIDWSAAFGTYSVKDHALASWLPVETIQNTDPPINAEINTARNLTNALELAQEVRVAAIVFLATTYPSGNKVQLSGTGQWGQSADAPLANVNTAIEGCFVRANTLVFGQQSWEVFRALPEVIEAIRSRVPATGSSVTQGFASPAEVATLFEVDNVYVGRARKITSVEGQTDTYARVWGKHMAALHLEPGISLDSVSFGKTFHEMDKVIYTDFDGKRGTKGSNFYKHAWNSDEKITASDLGYFIEDAVA